VSFLDTVTTTVINNKKFSKMREHTNDPARSFRKRRLTLPGKLLQDDADTTAAALSTIYNDHEVEVEEKVVVPSSTGSTLLLQTKTSYQNDGDDDDDPGLNSLRQEQPAVKKQRREESGRDVKPAPEYTTAGEEDNKEDPLIQPTLKRDSSSTGDTSRGGFRDETTSMAEKKTIAKSMTHMHMTQAFICRIRSRLLLNKAATKPNQIPLLSSTRQHRALNKTATGTSTPFDDNQVFKHDHLPFPKDVVGTFSCHGIEPLYGDYYDEDAEDVVAHSTSSPSSQVKEDHLDDEVVSQGAKATPVAEKINQDRGGVAYPYANSWSTALFATYDGHGEMGELVSHYAMTAIQKRLECHPDFDSNIEKALRETFVQVDEDLEEQEHIEPLYSGTTACVVIMRRNTLYIANAGDSRAVLARKRNSDAKDADATNPTQCYTAISLSVDQNPDSPGEMERIESCGGYVSLPLEPGLSARVWLDSDFTHIGLAMARSIGDHALKSVGVISEPVVTKHDIADNDEFIIIATDGVWVSWLPPYSFAYLNASGLWKPFLTSGSVFFALT
jgi:serine/threonine protein phosphatase PrpC